MTTLIVLLLLLGTALIGFIYFLYRIIASPQKLSHLKDLLKQDRTVQAVRVAKKLISKEPDNAEAHYYLGKAYLKENKKELAFMEFQTVNKLAKFSSSLKEVDFRKEMARLYEAFGNEEEALKEYIILMKKDPYNSEYYLKSGLLFEKRNKKDKAISLFRKAIKIDKRNQGAYYKLGSLLYQIRSMTEAKNALQKAIKLNKDDYKAWYYYGMILKDLHETTGAIQAFDKAEKDKEMRTRCFIEKGQIFLTMNQNESAIQYFEKAVENLDAKQASDYLFTHYYLANAYEGIRNFDKAISNWELVYSKKATFRDVAEKLSHYQDMKVDDRIKDYLTATDEEFTAICAVLLETMGFKTIESKNIVSGCEVIAVESEKKDWRSTRKLPVLYRFYRVSENISESQIRKMLEEMKLKNINSGVILTNASFNKQAREFADARPIDLYPKEKLQQLLLKAKKLE